MVSAVPNAKSGLLFGRSRGRIGADVGTRMIKFAQCRLAFGTWKVAAVHVQPVASRQVADTTGVLNGIVGQSLSDVSLRSLGFRGNSTMAALSSEIVAPRLLDLPDGVDDELAGMIREECELTESSSFDFWKSRSSSNRNHAIASVNAVILPKEQAVCCVDGLKQAGLRCEGITVQSMAMARAVQLMNPGDCRVAAVDWGASAPLLCICRNGHPEFSRVLRHCGLKAAVDEIATDLGISELDVAQLLVSFGVTSRQHDGGVIGSRINSLLSDHVQRFQNELCRTLEFLRQHRPDCMPDWICLFGGGATIADIDVYLADQLGCETRSWKLEPAQLDPDLRSLKFQSLFGVAIGLSTLETER